MPETVPQLQPQSPRRSPRIKKLRETSLLRAKQKSFDLDKYLQSPKKQSKKRPAMKKRKGKAAEISAHENLLGELLKAQATYKPVQKKRLFRPTRIAEEPLRELSYAESCELRKRAIKEAQRVASFDYQMTKKYRPNPNTFCNNHGFDHIVHEIIQSPALAASILPELQFVSETMTQTLSGSVSMTQTWKHSVAVSHSTESTTAQTQTETPTAISKTMGVKRKRRLESPILVGMSCAACHKIKKKCVRALPGHDCHRCVRMHRPCVVRNDLRNFNRGATTSERLKSKKRKVAK